MREVAWVVFDEIHYMRDKGTNRYPFYWWRLAELPQLVGWYGRRQSFYFLTKSDMYFCRPPYPMQCNLQSGLRRPIANLVMLSIRTSDLHHYNITFFLKVLMGST